MTNTFLRWMHSTERMDEGVSRYREVLERSRREDARDLKRI